MTGQLDLLSTGESVSLTEQQLRAVRGSLARLQQPYAANTHRSYERAWRQWAAWCTSRQRALLPVEPRELCAWLESLHQGARARATIELYCSAVATLDVAARVTPHDPSPASVLKSPVVRAWLRSYRRDVERCLGAPPLLRADMLAIVRAMDAPDPAKQGPRPSVTRHRDRALMLVGWLGALRRSELSALRREHVRVAPIDDGRRSLQLYLPRSKTDQEGDGAHVVIVEQRSAELCALRAWELYASNATGEWAFGRPDGGPLSGDAVHGIVMRRAAAAGVEATAHSLRVGLATEAAYQGVPERDIQRHCRWRTPTSLRRYIRAIDAARDNPTGALR